MYVIRIYGKWDILLLDALKERRESCSGPNPQASASSQSNSICDEKQPDNQIWDKVEQVPQGTVGQWEKTLSRESPEGRSPLNRALWVGIHLNFEVHLKQ